MSLRGLYKATKFSVLDCVKSFGGFQHRQVIDAAWPMRPAEISDYQTKLFRSAYEFALNKTPYYRERRNTYPQFKAATLPEFLRKLPILTKSAVREHNAEFWSQTRVPRTFHSTSGTSGTPIQLPGSLSERGFTQAVLKSWYERISGSRHPRTLSLSGFLTPGSGSGDLYWKSLCGRHVFVSIYALSTANRFALRSLIRSFQPEMYYGYASALHELAKLVEGAALNATHRIPAVTTSEVMSDEWRADVEAALHARVFNLYGCQEGTHVALECEHRWLHVHPLVGIVEVLDDEGQCAAAGTRGRVVVTTLAKRTMQLFRYELGDVATVPEDDIPCPCGLHWPRLGKIEGRSEDLVRTRDGRRIGYLLFHAAKVTPGIRYAQLVQTDYERFTFNIVLGSDAPTDRTLIEKSMRRQLELRLGYRTDLSFSYLDQIPRSERGKFKGVIVDF